MTPTDPTTTDDPDPDELAVHAVLDGEATPEQRRRVAREPGLRTRLDELRAAAEAMAEAPPTPAPDVLERIRAGALASLDAEPELVRESIDDAPSASPEVSPEAEVAPVAALPVRPPRRRLPALPAVAAIVLVLMVVGVALIATGGSDADQSAEPAPTSTAAEADAPEAGADAATGGAAAEEGDSRADAPAAEEALDLGDPGATYPDEQALRTALEQLEDPLTLDSLHPQPDPGATEREDAASRCGDVLRGADASIGEVQGSALVVVEDASYLVVSAPRAATRDAAASTRLFALDPVSCVPLLGVDR